MTRVTHLNPLSVVQQNTKPPKTENGKRKELTFLRFSHHMEGESSKRACVKVENDVVGGRWDELNPEILASIFVRIVPAEVMVRTVALVCRSWMEAVAGPYCWAEIDLENWCRKCCIANNFHLIDPLVRKIIRRSRFTFRRLSTYRLGNVGFSFAANWYCSSCCFV